MRVGSDEYVISQEFMIIQSRTLKLRGLKYLARRVGRGVQRPVGRRGVGGWPMLARDGVVWGCKVDGGWWRRLTR